MSKPRAMQVGKAHQLRLSPNGCYAVAIGRDVVLWDTHSRRRICSAHPLKWPAFVDFSLDGSRIAVKNTVGEIRVLGVPSLQGMATINEKPYTEGSQPLWSDCGRYLVDGSWNGLLRVHDTVTSKIVVSESHHNTMIKDLCSDSSRRNFAYILQPKVKDKVSPLASSKIAIRKWPFTSNSPTCLSKELAWVWAISLAPSGDRLAIFQQENSTEFRLLVCQVKPFKTISSKVVSWGANMSVTWSPDAKYVACVEHEKVVVFEALTLNAVADVPISYPCSVEFSRNGLFLAIGSWDKGRIEHARGW